MKLALVALVVVLLSFCHSGQAGGACGPKLMDLYISECGRRAARWFHIMRKYPHLFAKAQRAMGIRSKRSVSFTESMNTETRMTEAWTSRLIRVANKMAKERNFHEEHQRIRRGITQDCCYNHCDSRHIREKYCSRIHRHLRISM